jgi:hypothetical protein
MRVGDAEPLLHDMDAPLAVLIRSDEPGRDQTALAFVGAIENALGARLPEREAKRLRGTAATWAKARGDWMTLGLIGMEGIYARASLKDDAAADRVLKDAVSLASAPPFKQLLRVSDVKLGSGSALVSYGDTKKAQLTWTTANGELAATLIAPSAKAPTSAKLGDDPTVTRVVKALEANVTFAAIAQPLKLDPAKNGAAAAPLVLGWGRRGGDFWGRAEVHDVLIRELLRSNLGL